MTKSVTKYDDRDKARTLNAYLRVGGDLAHTHRVLRAEASENQPVPSIATISAWEEKYLWKGTLIEVRNRLQADAKRNALAHLRQDLNFLEVARVRLIEEIGGRFTTDGTCLQEPVRAKTLESACMALVRVIEAHGKLRGDEMEGSKEEAENILLGLMRTALGITPEEEKDGKIELQLEEQLDAGSGTGGDRGDPEGIEPVEDRGEGVGQEGSEDLEDYRELRSGTKAV